MSAIISIQFLFGFVTGVTILQIIKLCMSSGERKNSMNKIIGWLNKEQIKEDGFRRLTLKFNLAIAALIVVIMAVLQIKPHWFTGNFYTDLTITVCALSLISTIWFMCFLNCIVDHE